jgi:pimeloyl-ACP methyl ester carboxylesterase
VSSEPVRLSLSTGAEVQALVPSHGTAARPKCLLLHGNPGSLSDWQRVMAELSAVADVVAIDLPGFGQSPRSSLDPDCMSLARLAEHAVAVADALDWRQPFFIVGHSHGGGVAQAAAARHPQRVAGIVLVATLGGADAGGRTEFRLLPGSGHMLLHFQAVQVGASIARFVSS